VSDQAASNQAASDLSADQPVPDQPVSSQSADQPVADQSASNEAASDQAASDQAASDSRRSGDRATAGRGSAGSAGGARLGRRRAKHSAGPPAEDVQAGPGPLALAASAARVEAEARIRAALHQARRSTPERRPSDNPAHAALPAPANAADPATDEASMPRPEVASGAQPWQAELPTEQPDPGQPEDLASSWDGPQFDAEPARGGAEVEFQPESESDGYLDVDPDDDLPADEPADHAPSSYARRRIARAYSIPRLSRSKRPGAIPGAQQPG